jgi:hypothetical protein
LDAFIFALLWVCGYPNSDTPSIPRSSIAFSFCCATSTMSSSS